MSIKTFFFRKHPKKLELAVNYHHPLKLLNLHYYSNVFQKTQLNQFDFR